jgi:hypothetical protein
VKSLALPIACLLHPAAAQVQYGSVGGARFDENKIAVAADSRGIVNTSSGRGIDDSVCKVVALSRNIVFVSTGVVKSFGLGPLVPDWDNVKLARDAIAKISAQSPDARPDIAKIANEWIGATEANFNAMAVQKPEEFRQRRPESPGSFTVALLGGIDADGRMALFQMRIDASDSGRRAEGRFRRVENCGPYNLCVIGAQDMATEVAQKEVVDWAPPEGTSSEDYDVLRATRLVELTIQRHAGDDVGGMVDAIQLKRDGSLHWYAHKENCPEN